MNTPITYYGGKQRLADKIVSLMPEHRIYCEPYFGGGAVFFAKPKSYLEAINDINDNLINFWKQLRDNYPQLHKMINAYLHSESEHIRCKQIYYNPTEYSEIERAYAFWVVTNFSVNATIHGGWKWDNGASRSHIGITSRHKKERFVQELSDRLSDVQISCRDALKCISNRDTPDTLFYLDPPYLNADQKHYSGFKEEDMIQLLDVLTNLKGKFILSGYHAEILDTYIKKCGWQVMEIQVNCSAVHFNAKAVKKTELLITNYLYEEADK